MRARASAESELVLLVAGAAGMLWRCRLELALAELLVGVQVLLAGLIGNLAAALLLALAQGHRVAVFLARRPAARAVRPLEPRQPAQADAVEQLADETGITLIELAIAFVLNHPAITAALIGPRTVEQLESQLTAADVVLDAAVLDRIDEIVPPGSTLHPADNSFNNPALEPAARRRQTWPSRGCCVEAEGAALVEPQATDQPREQCAASASAAIRMSGRDAVRPRGRGDLRAREGTGAALDVVEKLLTSSLSVRELVTASHRRRGAVGVRRPNPATSRAQAGRRRRP